MYRAIGFAAAFLTAVVSMAGDLPSDLRPKLFHRFGDNVTNPDGMSADKDGNLYISGPNFNNKAYPGVIYKFKDAKPCKAELWFAAPVHPDTGIGAPMGQEWGADGALYYADNQYFFDKNYKSRLMRVVVDEKGVPVRTECVAEGFKLANAVRCDSKYVYVTDTFFDVAGKNQGGVYRIPYADLKADKPAKLLPKTDAVKDPYCIAISETTVIPSRGDTAGADGMCLDKDGNLYYGHFGDGKFFRISFKADGTPNAPELLSTALTCVDGINYCAKRDWVFINDSDRNAIRYWDIKKGTMNTLWINDDCDGADGLLDQPCESIVIDGKLIIACFDMPFPGLKNTKFDNINTMAVIDLDDGGCPFLRMLGL